MSELEYSGAFLRGRVSRLLGVPADVRLTDRELAERLTNIWDVVGQLVKAETRRDSDGADEALQELCRVFPQEARP